MTRLNSELEAYLSKPIIIVGAPRSGTTLMGKVLSRHPDLEYIQEPRMTWRYGNDGKSDMLKPRDARPEVIDYIRATFAEAVKSAGKRRLLEKTPSTGLRLGFVDKVFPDAKFVHIIRDGVAGTLAIHNYWLDYAHGLRGRVGPKRIKRRLKELQLRRLPHYGMEFIRRATPKPLRGVVGPGIWGPRIPGINDMARELDLLEVCAIQWRMCVELGCHYGRQLPADRYKEVRLEEMSQDLIRSVVEFCELPDDPGVLAFIEETFDSDIPARRRKEADPAQLELIKPWLDSTMTWLDRPSKAED